MKETKFIEQNREKWAEYEDMLRQNKKDPDKLNDLFIQITDDLSYARTFYPNRSVRVYLNGLAQQIFHNIFRGRRFPMQRLWRFWSEEMPQVMWEARRALLVSFSIFMFAVLIGIVSSKIEPDFARVILGDGYVDMTIQNIERGDPMAVYKEREAFGMSLGIALNNIWVALLTALLGVVASVGTVFLLLTNGVMLGAFQWFFVERGLFWDSFLTIWIHGTLEISAIIIAGAAGLTAGSGLLFPGAYTRGQAFQLSARRGMKIFIGLIPVFALAAFFEGFLTRFTETPDLVRGLFIFTSLAFVLFYFVFLPWRMARQGFAQPLREKELPPTRPVVIDFSEIKSSGEIFSDVFTVLKRHGRAFFGSLAVATLFFCVGVFNLSESAPSETFYFRGELTGVVNGAVDFFGKTQLQWLVPFQTAVFVLLSFYIFAVFRREMPEELRPANAWWRALLVVLTLALPALGMIYIFKIFENIFCWITLVVGLPFLSLWAFALYYEGPNPFTSFVRAWSLMRWSVGFWVGFIVVNFSFLLFLFLDSPIFGLLAEFLGFNVRSGEGNMENFMAILITTLAATTIYLTVWTSMLSGALQYFSYSEILDAVSLREGIENVGQSRQIRGLARE